MENGYWSALLVDIGLKIAGAIVVWAIGRWLIALAMRRLSARNPQIPSPIPARLNTPPQIGISAAHKLITPNATEPIAR